MPLYRVRCHGASYQLESPSRDAALVYAFSEIIAKQLRSLVPTDLVVEDSNDFAPPVSDCADGESGATSRHTVT